MARYKHIATDPKFLPVDLARQLLPGTFEHALDYLIDHELDLSAFDARYRNDETGAPAYPPGVLLKVILAAYAHGVVGSRGIAATVPRARDVHRALGGRSAALHDDRGLCEHAAGRDRAGVRGGGGHL